MLNLYQALKSFPPFSRQLVCRGMLFTNYDCPQQESKMSFFIEHSFILFVLAGRRIYHWQGQTWNLEEGCCAFVKRGAIVAERPKDEEWCVMAFFVPDDFLSQMVTENRKVFPGNSLVPAEVDEPLIMLDVSDISKSGFFSMLPYFTQSPSPPENLVELKFKELILSLLVNPRNPVFLSYTVGLSNGNRHSLQQIMNNNFAFHLSIADYAKLSCKSVSTFKREFKKYFSETPARWLMKKRMDKARDLLENTTLPISDITTECGFENPNHFSRVFKLQTGASPLQFRQNSKSPVSR